MMAYGGSGGMILPLLGDALDAATGALIRLAAWVAGGSEADVRDGLDACAAAAVPDRWIEELILQSYLFAGFPRTLNAAREWRARGGSPSVSGQEGFGDGMAPAWRAAGEHTCAVVYGRNYRKLRENIRELHPELDGWMIVEGYGKVLSRGGLDLGRRELCIVAACAATKQKRQLHSHLYGARNAGVAEAVVSASLDALDGAVTPEALNDARMLWQRAMRT